MNNLKTKLQGKWPLISIIGAYLSPVVLYVLTFGPTLSNEHGRWAEFGSAMAGIYAPIVALTTLAVLVKQVALQRQMNEHEFQQAYFAQARSDVEFYAEKLVHHIDQIGIPGVTYRAILDREFRRLETQELDRPELRQLAANLDFQAPEILALWMAINPILQGLATSQLQGFQMTFESSKSKLIALLGFAACVTLDNYHRIRTEGRFSMPYLFSEAADTSRRL